MQLRSGRALPEMVFFKEDMFTSILAEVGDWPTENQAYQLSTRTTDMLKFAAHLRWLMTHTTSSKTNRLVLMAIAWSLMNVAHDRSLRRKWGSLYEMVIRKMEEYNGPPVTAFDFDKFLADFKALVAGFS